MINVAFCIQNMWKGFMERSSLESRIVEKLEKIAEYVVITNKLLVQNYVLYNYHAK